MTKGVKRLNRFQDSKGSRQSPTKMSGDSARIPSEPKIKSFLSLALLVHAWVVLVHISSPIEFRCHLSLFPFHHILSSSLMKFVGSTGRKKFVSSLIVCGGQILELPPPNVSSSGQDTECTVHPPKPTSRIVRYLVSVG